MEQPSQRSRSDSYSTLEVARLLHVTVQTVQRWVDAGHLKAWRTVGGHRRIDADSVRRFREAAVIVGEARPVAEAAPAAAGEQPMVVASVPRALVVDDDPADRELAGYLLRRLRPEWNVEFVDNGFAALLAIGRELPDVLITDINMPFLNGPAMLRTLFETPGYEKMAILAVSSHSTAEIAALGGLPAGVAFLHKPLNRNALQAFLDSAGPQAAAAAGTP